MNISVKNPSSALSSLSIALYALCCLSSGSSKCVLLLSQVRSTHTHRYATGAMTYHVTGVKRSTVGYVITNAEDVPKKTIGVRKMAPGIATIKPMPNVNKPKTKAIDHIQTTEPGTTASDTSGCAAAMATGPKTYASSTTGVIAAANATFTTLR